MVLVEPEQSRRCEEAAHLVAPVVEDARVPLRVEALARVLVLEQVRAVEVGQPVLVGRKVRGHPVEDHADAALVQVVHEVHEVLRRAVAGGRREVAGGLVAPGAVERVLGDGHQLHVREAGLDHVVGQQRRQLALARHAAVGTAPRPQRAPRTSPSARRARSSRRATPSIRRRPSRTRATTPASRWPAAARRARRTGRPCRPRAGRRATRCGTCRPGLAARLGTSRLPDARAVAARAHRLRRGIPAVEFSDDGDLARVGCPYRELGAAVAKPAAELLVHPRVGALAEQVDVVVAQHFLVLGKGCCGAGHRSTALRAPTTLLASRALPGPSALPAIGGPRGASRLQACLHRPIRACSATSAAPMPDSRSRRLPAPRPSACGALPPTTARPWSMRCAATWGRGGAPGRSGGDRHRQPRDG